MAKRGRTSAAELEAPRALVERQARPDACYSLADEAAEVWQATVEALPADYISAEALPVLAAYCRTTVSLRRLGQLIHACEHGPEDLDVATYTKLLSSHAQQSQVLKTLATSLRLTPQTRYKAEAAERKTRGYTGGKKPWDV